MRLFCFVPLLLLGCAAGAAPPAPTPTCTAAPSEGGDTCLGLGPATTALSDIDASPSSILGTPLETCSLSPMTGFFRDGLCRTGAEDRGVHVVCAEVDAAFLRYTARQGNDLSTPRPSRGFAGLRPGDRWCLCAARWEEARQDGVAPPVVPESTHSAALRSTTVESLTKHAVSAQPQAPTDSRTADSPTGGEE